VIVNRIWQGHFGRGIVATADDFGERGQAPSNPELLDFLTSYFIGQGWSIKAMHRLIVLSRAYQAGGAFIPADAEKDANNDYAWRFSRRRLDAEEFRDTLLFLGCDLDLKPGGPHPFPPETSWVFTEHNAFLGTDPMYANRKRSVYMLQQRIRQNAFLELFDGADTNAETGLRPLTTTALQALYRMNDPFFRQEAAALAARVALARNSDSDRLRFAYRLVFSRFPEAAEVEEDRRYLAGVQESLKGAGMLEDERTRESWISLMRVLLSSNEFLTLE
jgi:hypothetical protein